MREEHKHVDENFVAGTLDFEVLEEHVDSEVHECLVDDVVPLVLVVHIRRPIDLSFEGNYRHAACCFELRVLIVDRMLSLLFEADVP